MVFWCEAQGFLVTTNVCNTWERHTLLTFRLALDIWLRCAAEKETRNNLSLVVAWWLPIICRITTYPTCTQIWMLCYSMAAFRSSSSRTCGQSLRVSLQRDRYPDKDSWKVSGCKFAHSNIPKGLTYSATWCDVRQASIKFKRQTASNELLRHWHVSLPLFELWRMCAQRNCIGQ